MDPSFWNDRWREGRTAFHEGRTNAHLARHITRLGPNGRVFVPLCGKTEDMAFLAARGHEVLGIDVVPLAVDAFFREHGLTPTVEQEGPFRLLRGGGVSLLEGNVFDLTKPHLAGVTAVYDRAALVALPTDMRASYVALLRTLLAPGTPFLVVTFDYAEGAFEGPPFAVGEAEMRRLYDGCTVEKLDEVPVTTGRLAEANARASEQAWLVTLGGDAGPHSPSPS